MHDTRNRTKIKQHSTNGLVHYRHALAGAWCARISLQMTWPTVREVDPVTCLWCLAGVPRA